MDEADAPPFRLAGHIQPGDMAPWWQQGRHRFLFDTLAGRYLVLGFHQSAADAAGAAALRALDALARGVAAGTAHCLAIARDPRDAACAAACPAVRFVDDAEGAMYHAYGIGDARLWIVLDPMLRVVATIPLRADGADAAALETLLLGLPPPERCAGAAPAPPVLVLPRVFEPELCRHLIDLHARDGGRESGFMQEVGGQAVERLDPAWKRRRDLLLGEPALIEAIKARFARRVAPMLRRAFQFQLSRMERHLVACYAAAEGGHFGPHRDDTVRATAHRRFAASINLNADFAGGELVFPEFGPRRFKAPPGAALIFSAALLHQVLPVTEGRRYAFLPFLHDEAAERQRLANLAFLARPEAAS